MKDLSNLLRQQVIDSRDIMERIEELKEESRFLKKEIQWSLQMTDLPQANHLNFLKKDLENEIALLCDFKTECESHSTEFQYGETIIACHYFEDYCEELARDCGYLPQLERNTHNPINNFIDWSNWAEHLKADYAEVSCDGNNFLIRNC